MHIKPDCKFVISSLKLNLLTNLLSVVILHFCFLDNFKLFQSFALNAITTSVCYLQGVSDKCDCNMSLYQWFSTLGL